LPPEIKQELGNEGDLPAEIDVEYGIDVLSTVVEILASRYSKDEQPTVRSAGKVKSSNIPFFFIISEEQLKQTLLPSLNDLKV
jgi:hypothetical protein